MKDHELENILKELRQESVADQRVQGWKTALRGEKKAIQRNKRARILPLMLASFTGFVFGAALFSAGSFLQFEEPEENNLAENATIEYIYNKID